MELVVLDISTNQFSGDLPSCITKLKKLQKLDLQSNMFMGEISNTLNSWTELAELNLSNNKLTGEIPSGLGDLPVLMYLDLGRNLLSGGIPAEDVRLKELLRFNISVDKYNYEFIGDSGYEFPNELRLAGFSNSVPFEAKMKALTSRIEDLVIESTEGLVSIACESDEESFLKLKTIDICDCGHLKEMCKGLLLAGSFERLERVTLYKLRQMEHLWRGPVEPPYQVNLKYISLESCKAIKSLFPQSVVKCLMQLQELDVAECKKLEGIISDKGAEYENVAKTIEFPKLNSLRLVLLPRFKSFSTTMM
ncbi:hypothetical protein LguiA_024566 [Lonicera macranthoides]